MLQSLKNNQRSTILLAYGFALVALLYWLFQSPRQLNGEQFDYIRIAQDFYINHRFSFKTFRIAASTLSSLGIHAFSSSVANGTGV